MTRGGATVSDDVGYLRRVDRGGGWSDLVDGWGNPAVRIRTEFLDGRCKNGDVRRFRTRLEPNGDRTWMIRKPELASSAK